MKTINWTGCYSDGWGDLLVPEAFAHPAKFSYGLIQRIVRSGLARGFWRAGSLIGDPFAGVACGGLVAAYHGLRWLGVELEPRFVDLGNQNIRKHRPRYEVAGDPVPVLVQGDSRQFASIVGQCEAIVTSPPFVDVDTKPTKLGSGKGTRAGGDGAGRNKGDYHYPTAPGQIGSLKAGELDAVVTSPPYAEGKTHPSLGHPELDGKSSGDFLARATTQTQPGSESYGQTPGNIGNLKEGRLDAVVTSPPFMSTHAGHDDDGYFAPVGGVRGKGAKYSNERPVNPTIGGDRNSEAAKEAQRKRAGNTANIGCIVQSGNAGRLVNTETYWQAVAAVYEQCRLALKPGGYLVVVVKDYVKKKKRVPLCDQTVELLTRLGFDVVERTRAWLVEHEEQPGLFGGTIVKTRERKSFFRRLHQFKAEATAFWATLTRQERAAWLRKAHADDWESYRVRLAEWQTEAEHKEHETPPRKPTPKSILTTAQTIAFSDAGKPPQDIDMRIDFEEVIWARS